MEFITTGGLVVEVMRKELDKPFTQAADLTGPYPSGDAGIFIDTAARLGNSCGILGAVGDDDFGRCLLERFARDGVDTSLMHVAEGHTTGVAFVAYYTGGRRSFIYHMRESAATHVNLELLTKEALRDVKWAHITGVNMSIGPALEAAALRILECLPEGAKVSFDPNIRPEVLTAGEIRALCAPVLDRADVFFPSSGEAMMFTGADSDDEGCRRLAAQGKLVVMKNGTEGCLIYKEDERIAVPAFAVEEVDPTGAGDSFCAGFLTALEKGWALARCGRFANAVGALAVTKTGPMEGAPSLEETLAFLRQNDPSEGW